MVCSNGNANNNTAKICQWLFSISTGFAYEMSLMYLRC